ncbi:hypothetical protein ED733_007923 [Metarhizium rileyi]|uniref:Glycosyltransferase 2 n=1 Tax=Metarhizium rileyi (strain RCEF 4871) TaxID=1649241 RepID=A0A5C6GKL6_METRR|nr:hypothetical protein ED733_007923 [Metarhizium rileyi]
MPRRTWVRRLAAYALFIVALVYLFNRSSSTSPSSPPRSRGDGYDAVNLEVAGQHRFDAPGSTHVDVASEKSSHPHQAPSAEFNDRQKGTDKAWKEIAAVKSESVSKYEGPIWFPALASSLRAISSTNGASLKNSNLLFAAASLKSASTLLSMACEMVLEREIYAHFVFISTADITMQDLLEVNGIDRTCPLILHDARPDYFEASTERRMSLAVVKALRIINSYMHPQAIFVDSTNAEEDYFLHAVRDQVSSTRSALIELPERPRTSLSWISKLDPSALSGKFNDAPCTAEVMDVWTLTENIVAWNKVRFEILIHATPTGTANLKRLLRSIARADLAGIQTPHITVEVPNIIEDSLESYLASFKWPRPTPYHGQPAPMISLRRRITRQLMDEEDSSVRFVESFWPTDPSNSHVLVLSPHTEITPQFFQYVKYSLLHQLHSKTALMGDHRASLLGISLSVPTTLIDGTRAFTPPRPLHDGKDAPGETSFLWQRPNSEAMVFLGEKWVELHHLITQTLYKKRSMSSVPELLAKRQVGKKYPAWLEYALRLSRIRGYSTLYPSRETANAIIGVHSDVPDTPEEYLNDGSRSKSPKDILDEGNERFEPVSPVDMLETLPRGGKLPSLRDVPLLSWDGKVETVDDLAKDADDYTALFRKEVGGCEDDYSKSRHAANKLALDLFCRHDA